MLHGASPLCHWSYGYEPVLQRIRLVYGDQVKVNVYTIPVYESFDQWMKDYELDDAGLREWMAEAQGLIRLPVNMDYFERPTESCVPATLAVHAAELAEPGAGERLARLVGHAMSIEGRALGDDDLLQLAERVGAPRKQVEAAIADGRAEVSVRTDAQSMHALGLDFYALQLRDSDGRTVILEHAFDSAKVEDALDWLGRGELRKNALPQPLDYAARHAPVSLREMEQVFRLDAAGVERALEPAVKARKLVRKEMLGHPFWLPP